MSITSNFPAIKPTLLLDFANTKQLDSRITFTRASTATYYDGVTTAKAEENLLVQSQDFTTTWVNQATTDTANTTVAPDGTTTADTITANAGAATHSIIQTITAPLGANVLSVFAKAGTNNYIQLFLGGQTGTFANFDITAGAGVTGTSSGVVSAAITSVGNDWYRCVMIFTQSTSTSVQIGLVSSSSAVRAESWTTVGTETIILWGAQLEQRSAVTAYTPTTTATITNYVPQILTAASGVARFDHNPTTFESLGLEIEEARTNLILQSEDLDTTWSETRATLSLNSVVAPNGALTADRLIASTDNNTHFTSQTFTGTAASHTFSVYAKASGLNHVALRLFNGTSQVGLAYYNLSTGATGTVTAGTAAITSVGNGYYRCSLTATLAASASCTSDIQLANADNTNSFIGNAFDGVTLWGTQVELGAFATSYIPTVASQVTRAADAASMTGTNFSSWFNQGEGTLYIDYNLGLDNISIDVCMFDDATANNNMQVRYASGSQAQYTVTTGNVNQASLAPAGYSATGNYKRAVTYATNSFNQAINGVLPTAEDTSGVVPIVTNLRIGGGLGGTPLNSTIRKVAYYPLRVTNAQLQALTS